MALAIPRALSDAVRRYEAGERVAAALREPVSRALAEAGLELDYATLAHPEDLVPFEDGATIPDRAVLAVAAFSGGTRLIDNVVLGEDPAPRVVG